MAGPFMMIVWLLLLVGLLAGGAVLVSRAMANRDRRSAPGRAPDGALEELDARYARGEIDEQEYEHRRRTLRR